MKRNFFIFCIFYSLIAQTWAQSYTSIVKISQIRTGWNSDVVAVTFTGSIPNPANCTTPDSIILNVSTPGFKTHYAAILTAMANQNDVQIIIANTGCTSNRPTFWGITIFN